MLDSVAKAARALAAWRAVESDAVEDMDAAVKKASIATAHEMFLREVYAIAFDLVPKILDHGEIAVVSEVHYSAVAGGGGFIVQNMNFDHQSLGVLLMPNQVSIENWLQLMIDLPEILETLGVK
ncbi:hypothetical protein HYX70_01795 [Candidatus Saccharibacteria bacterium]|nr:hypothetical protein [Candidatus Saccharibacteria bacterium]